MSLVIYGGKRQRRKNLTIFLLEWWGLSGKQSPSFKRNGVVQEMRMFPLLGCCVWNCLYICDGSLWLQKRGRTASEGTVNLQPPCTLILHRPNFSWTATVYRFSNDTASGLLKMPAVNGGCLGAVLQAAQFSVCLCYRSKRQLGLKTHLPLTTLQFTLWSSLRTHNLDSFGVKPNRNLRSQSAAQSLAKLWMFSPWSTPRAGQHKPPLNAALWMLRLSAPSALRYSWLLFNFNNFSSRIKTKCNNYLLFLSVL